MTHTCFSRPSVTSSMHRIMVGPFVTHCAEPGSSTGASASLPVAKSTPNTQVRVEMNAPGFAPGFWRESVAM
ncbi:Uncharacterised protein [Mycobacteroides abscessus subsp. abscessus]|nr:Uncharacterised protein [Mycobacteroides abscessus subsp. abscessus]